MTMQLQLMDDCKTRHLVLWISVLLRQMRSDAIITHPVTLLSRYAASGTLAVLAVG